MLYIICLFIVVTVAWGFGAYLWERHDWNGGICRKTGLPWEYFDTDSQGGRGYHSKDEVVWISWPFIEGSRVGGQRP